MVQANATSDTSYELATLATEQYVDEGNKLPCTGTGGYDVEPLATCTQVGISGPAPRCACSLAAALRRAQRTCKAAFRCGLEHISLASARPAGQFAWEYKTREMLSLPPTDCGGHQLQAAVRRGVLRRQELCHAPGTSRFEPHAA